MGSFYDLDYIIEINEKRLEQYSGAYQKSTDKFTNIFIIYSAFAIFLIPVIQLLFFSENKCAWVHYISFYIFIVLSGISLIYTVRLLLPVNRAPLGEPRMYYAALRQRYEEIYRERDEVDKLIKASYIDELEQAVQRSKAILKRKARFYHIAFSFALVACVPYLLCVGFQISIKDDKVQKMEIVNNFSNFDKTLSMAQDSAKKEDEVNTVSELPGVDSAKVIRVEVFTIKEGLQFGFDEWFKKSSKKKK
jgi:hypothetical protein